MRAELDLGEHTLLLPRGEHALACQVGQVHLAFCPVLVAQPDAIASERSNLNWSNHGHYLLHPVSGFHLFT